MCMRKELIALYQQVYDVDKGEMKACGREKTMQLIEKLNAFSQELELTYPKDYFGREEYGILNLENVNRFFKLII